MTESEQIIIRVYGVPQPGGSKRAFVNPKTGRAIITEDAKHNKTWREAVKQATLDATQGLSQLYGPVSLTVTFIMPRPKNHYRTGKHAGELRPDAPYWHIKKPDRTKLLRSTEDALTDSGIWHDDTQVVTGNVEKRYAKDGERAGAEIVIERITEAGNEDAYT